jgi:hypothetical protein
MDIYIHSPLRLHGVVLNLVNDRGKLTLVGSRGYILHTDSKQAIYIYIYVLQIISHVFKLHLWGLEQAYIYTCTYFLPSHSMFGGKEIFRKI